MHINLSAVRLNHIPPELAKGSAAEVGQDCFLEIAVLPQQPESNSAGHGFGLLLPNSGTGHIAE